MDWILVALLGALVGVGELVARYRDRPHRALVQGPALLYLAINAAAAVVALILIRTFGWEFGLSAEASTAEVRFTQVLVAGLGALALFRSSLFLVRVGNQDVGVGPNSFLQIILTAADRGVDRLRAEDRAKAVQRIMKGVSYAKAKVALPTYCLALMQNLSAEDQTIFGDQIAKLQQSEIDDYTKALAVGLLIMTYMGEDVLVAAVDSLGPVIKDPESDTNTTDRRQPDPAAKHTDPLASKGN